jgi:predicted transcriptional regulator
MALFDKTWFRGSLGPLEQELLRAVWRRGDATVRELTDSGEVEGAYTTLMTTLDRLYKKGILAREAEGRAFRYRPLYSEEDLKRNFVADGLKQLFGSKNPAPAPVSFLVDEITKHDATLLDELERAIERKRRELGKKGSR